MRKYSRNSNRRKSIRRKSYSRKSYRRKSYRRKSYRRKSYRRKSYRRRTITKKRRKNQKFLRGGMLQPTPLERVVGMGFEVDSAVAALAACDDDPERAIEQLRDAAAQHKWVAQRRAAEGDVPIERQLEPELVSAETVARWDAEEEARLEN